MLFSIFHVTGHETQKRFHYAKHKYISNISCSFRLKMNNFTILKKVSYFTLAVRCSPKTHEFEAFYDSIFMH